MRDWITLDWIELDYGFGFWSLVLVLVLVLVFLFVLEDRKPERKNEGKKKIGSFGPGRTHCEVDRLRLNSSFSAFYSHKK